MRICKSSAANQKEIIQRTEKSTARGKKHRMKPEKTPTTASKMKSKTI
jgi:hypothetical protein